MHFLYRFVIETLKEIKNHNFMTVKLINVFTIKREQYEIRLTTVVIVFLMITG